MIYLIIYLILVILSLIIVANNHGAHRRIHAGWSVVGTLLVLSLLTAGGAFQPIFAALAG